MATMAISRYITHDPALLGSEPMIIGTKTPVRTIVQSWRLGIKPEEIPMHLPNLTLAQVFDALSYYVDHQDQINHYIERNRATVNVANPVLKETNPTQAEDYLEFVEPDYIRIKGHRLGIEHVLAYYKDGYKAPEIIQEFPGLSLEKVKAVIAYYWQNRQEVEAYLRRGKEDKEREYQEWLANLPPYSQRLRALMEQRRNENSLSL